MYLLRLSLVAFLVAVGTFKFNYDGDRINGDQTPAEVSAFVVILSKSCILTYNLIIQLNMEDGDMIDAFLEQVCPYRFLHRLLSFLTAFLSSIKAWRITWITHCFVCSLS